MAVFRNAEGYYDPTAGRAITEVDRMNVKIGDIVKTTRTNGTEKFFAVLGIRGSIATGIALTDEYRDGAVVVNCQGVRYAQPERLEHLYYTQTQGEFIRAMSDDELDAIREGVADLFDLTLTAAQTAPVSVQTDEAIEIAAEQAERLIRATTRAEVYKGLYEDLLNRCMKTA